MAAAATLTVDELPAWVDSQARAIEGMDFGPAVKTCLQITKGDVGSNFQGSHSPDGTPFRPLLMARARGGATPLQDRGLLKASMVANGTGHVESVGPRGFVVGTNLIGAAVHQDGGTITPKKGRFLAIPRTPEAARIGSPRGFPPGRLSPRIGARGGVLVDNGTKGKGSARRKAGIVQFLLLRKVTIPARPFAGFSSQALADMDEAVADYAASQVLR